MPKLFKKFQLQNAKFCVKKPLKFFCDYDILHISAQPEGVSPTYCDLRLFFVFRRHKNGTEYTKDTKEEYPSATIGGSMSDYVVHPAFDYGGNHLTGFWIGKLNFVFSHSILDFGNGMCYNYE